MGSRSRSVALVRVRRCTHSLKRDGRFHDLTTVADVTQDHANPRAGTLTQLVEKLPVQSPHLFQILGVGCCAAVACRLEQPG